jgi:hypothetical protein
LSTKKREITNSFQQQENYFQQFRQKELKGELEPEIFYKNEYTQEGSSNHRNIEFKLNLDFDPEDRLREKAIEDEHQNQINRLNLDLDVSSRYSNDNSEKPEIDVSFN